MREAYGSRWALQYVRESKRLVNATSSGLSNNERCREDQRLLDLLATRQAQQLPGQLPAQLHDRLADRGQRRFGVPGELEVVEADHRHVVGYPPARLAQGAQRAV